MKIAFASEHPADKIGAFSGVPYFMSHALRAASESLDYIQTPAYDFADIRDDRKRGLQDLERAGRYLSERLNGLDVDVIVCQGSSMIPFLKTDRPVILWHDATWLAQMQTDLETFRVQYPVLYEWDQCILERCDLIVFAADWVREQTRTSYGISSAKMVTLPFGANVKELDTAKVKDAIASREPVPCQLTFLGVDWRRKGLEKAYQVCRNLNQGGLATVLNVIGCHVYRVGLRRRLKHYLGPEPFTETEQFQMRFHTDPVINNLGFLKKEHPADYARFCGILSRSHFLLHPADFECFGIALVEANAFGVPVIASDRYGPQTIIRNGLNGHLFCLEEFVERATALIRRHMREYDGYKELARKSLEEQQSRLDWSHGVQQLHQVLVQRGYLRGDDRLRECSANYFSNS